MGIILDIILILIISSFIFIGYKKGLAKVICGLISIILSLILTIILYKPITNFVLDNTQIDENIANFIQEKITINDDKETNSEEENQILNKYINNTKNNLENGIIVSTSEIISVNLVSIVVLLILFVIIRIIIMILVLLSNSITELPIIKQFNKTGGILYGALEGIIIIYILLAIAFFIITSLNKIQVLDIIDSSYITRFLYENNIILKILF